MPQRIEIALPDVILHILEILSRSGTAQDQAGTSYFEKTIDFHITPFFLLPILKLLLLPVPRLFDPYTHFHGMVRRHIDCRARDRA